MQEKMVSQKREHQKIEEPEATRLPLKLGDLAEDVLIKIFSYLDATDLMNLVRFDKMFLSCCRQAFGKTYKESFIELPVKERTIEDFATTVELLSNFGRQITRVSLNIHKEIVIRLSIYHLIVTHCRETLTAIKFAHSSLHLKINKPFPNVKTLIVCNGFVDTSVWQFHKWFPMLENLFVNRVGNIAALFNERRTIPSLKCFSLKLTNGRHNVHIQGVNAFIKCNPQLNEVRLPVGDILFKTDDSVNVLGGGIVPEKIMTVKLYARNVRWSREYSETLAQLAVPNDRIERLEIFANELTKQMGVFITKCVNLQFLKIEIFDQCSNDALTPILPFLMECISLNTVMITIKDYYAILHEPFDSFRTKIDVRKWSVSTYEVRPRSFRYRNEYEVSLTLKKL